MLKQSLIALVFLSSCGGATNSILKLPGGSNSPNVIPVSLNDAFTTVAPNGSEKVQTTDDRYFTPPSAINIVQGVYTGNAPGQYLHGRIKINAEHCDYQSNSINNPVLSLMYCTGGIGANTLLSNGAVIELENYDAPGYLLEANFNLVK